MPKLSPRSSRPAPNAGNPPPRGRKQKRARRRQFATTIYLGVPTSRVALLRMASMAALRKKRPRRVYHTIHDFDQVEVLGFGSTGVVSKARHHATGETFAVKAVRGDGHGGFSPAGLRDLDCLDACGGHPNVVQYLGVHLDRRTGDLFTFMELAGASLRGRLTRQHTEAETRAYMRQLLGAAEWTVQFRCSQAV
ncbi:hypothetical protein ACP4OV_010035 [Aristida adscensionis]